jgi:riboflavin biosynthesis pyrimidine reductase
LTALSPAVAEMMSPDRPPRIEPLWGVPDTGGEPRRGGRLPEELAARYGADLVIPLRDGRPTVIANFVSTIDGVVSFDDTGSGGGRAVSGDFEPDRFLMGLLRATADAVLVGAGTVRASHTRAWTPGRAHPASASAFARWRQQLGLGSQPTAVLLTSSGVLDSGGPWSPRGDQPTTVMTTDLGAERLRADGVPGIEVIVSGQDGRVSVQEVLDRLAGRGCRVVLCEAGPTVFGELVAAELVDELFLTIAPRIAGRDGPSIRPGLAQGVAFQAALAPGLRLRTVMRAGDHLFLRYSFDPAGQGHGGSR